MYVFLPELQVVEMPSFFVIGFCVFIISYSVSELVRNRTGYETKQKGMFRLLRNNLFCVYYGRYTFSFKVNIIINMWIEPERI